MSLKKLVTNDGSIRWVARARSNGRGSKEIFKTFSRKSDAEAFLEDLKKEKKERIQNPFSAVSFADRTFKDEADYWLSNNEIRFSASHLVRVRGILAEIMPKFGNLPIDRFTPEFLSAYQRTAKASGSANGTVNRKTEVVTSILNHSAKHRRIPFSPATGFQKLAKGHKEMLFWNTEEASSFLESMDRKYPIGSDGRWVYAAYLLALNTGLRAGEIWGLKPIDLPTTERVLHVRRQFNRVSLKLTATKSGKSRVVPCGPELTEELQRLVRQNKVSSDETVFMNSKRLPICHDNFTDREFVRDLKSWGGREIRFHDLRHTATTLLIASGVDLKTVKEICGHANIQTTMNYAHLVGGAIENVANSFSIRPAGNLAEKGAMSVEPHFEESKVRSILGRISKVR